MPAFACRKSSAFTDAPFKPAAYLRLSMFGLSPQTGGYYGLC